MLISHPRDTSRFNVRWPEFIEDMTAEPLTVLLLSDREGQAAEKWRAGLGHWNVDARRDPVTIRGVYANDELNNLVHGSDPGNVSREVSVIATELR